MRITGIEVYSVSMPLTNSYSIAYQTVDKTTNVFIHLKTNGKEVGFGCAAPDIYITKETPEGVEKALREIAFSEIKGSDPLRIAFVLEKVRSRLGSQPSAMAALDMALYDLLGKVSNLPLWKLLGGFRDRIKTSITIGILSEEETIRQARNFVARGFKSIKIKGGKDVDDDIMRVLRVREEVGPRIELRFDANQGYTEEQALKFVEKTRSAKLELLEQPTPKGHPDLLGRVTSAVHIPIMADESLLTLRDSFRLAKKNLVDMVNVKLMKVGGIFSALEINAVAKSAGLEVMVGCMDESALGIAAGLHFALARPNVIYADLDGHIDLQGDPADGAVTLKDGILYPTNRPGLGFNLK